MRRSLLYIPASSQKMLNKALTLPADTIALDLEDGVAQTAKTVARDNLIERYADLKKNCKTPELGIRLNAVSSGDLFLDDIKFLENLEVLPNCILIPKVDTVWWNLFKNLLIFIRFFFSLSINLYQ